MTAAAVVGDKTRRAVRDALNGDYDNVDPALRRALFAISTELDEHSAAQEARHGELMKSMDGIRRLLVSTSVTFVIALGTGLLNLVIN